MHFTSQGSDFTVFLLDNGVQSFALLSQYFDLIFTFSTNFLDSCLIFVQFSPQLIILNTYSLELVLKLADLTSWKSQVFLGCPYFLTQTCVLSKQFLDSLLVGLWFLSGASKSVFEFIEISTQSLSLSCRKSQVLLVFLNFSTKCSNFAVFLLHYWVQSFALLSQDFHLVLSFSNQPLDSGFVFCIFLFELVVLSTNILELVLELAQLTCRKSQILLSGSNFLAQTVVFSQ